MLFLGAGLLVPLRMGEADTGFCCHKEESPVSKFGNWTNPPLESSPLGVGAAGPPGGAHRARALALAHLNPDGNPDFLKQRQNWFRAVAWPVVVQLLSRGGNQVCAGSQTCTPPAVPSFPSGRLPSSTPRRFPRSPSPHLLTPRREPVPFVHWTLESLLQQICFSETPTHGLRRGGHRDTVLPQLLRDLEKWPRPLSDMHEGPVSVQAPGEPAQDFLESPF